MQDPADQSQFINELLDQQDAVISQLDELLLRIDEVLKVAVIASSDEQLESPLKLIESPAEGESSKRAA